MEACALCGCGRNIRGSILRERATSYVECMYYCVNQVHSKKKLRIHQHVWSLRHEIVGESAGCQCTQHSQAQRLGCTAVLHLMKGKQTVCSIGTHFGPEGKRGERLFAPHHLIRYIVVLLFRHIVFNVNPNTHTQSSNACYYRMMRALFTWILILRSHSLSWLLGLVWTRRETLRSPVWGKKKTYKSRPYFCTNDNATFLLTTSTDITGANNDGAELRSCKHRSSQ